MTLDIPSENILVAFSNRAGCRSTASTRTWSPGAQVTHPEPIDPGIYGHQVRVSPSTTARSSW